MELAILASWVHLDGLGGVMGGLVGFIGLIVGRFAWKYLRGDRSQKPFYRRLLMLMGTLGVLVTANHLLLFWGAWVLSNILLVQLMVPHPQWRAARASGVLAGKNFLIGALALGLGFLLLADVTGQTSIQAILNTPGAGSRSTLALALLALAAWTQSALWPFHRWLLSSLNSPTPVSALMHAGLINGGGFLFARFAPLYLETSALLLALFVGGLLTAWLGTFWKLLQSDVKRMLACSTMGQMGFMIMQVALGLIPAAVAHLFWHGLFKAYLFLSSGSAAQEKKAPAPAAGSRWVWLWAGLGGGLASFSFAQMTGKTLAADTTFFLLVIAGLAGLQVALTLLTDLHGTRIFGALLLTGGFGAVYGVSVAAIESLLAPLNLMQPQPLHPLHGVGLVLLLGSWWGARLLASTKELPRWYQRLYLWGLNASQPAPPTVTAYRSLERTTPSFT